MNKQKSDLVPEDILEELEELASPIKSQNKDLTILPSQIIKQLPSEISNIIIQNVAPNQLQDLANVSRSIVDMMKSDGPFGVLPDDILFEILSNLDEKSKESFSRTQKSLRKRINPQRKKLILMEIAQTVKDKKVLNRLEKLSLQDLNKYLEYQRKKPILMEIEQNVKNKNVLSRLEELSFQDLNKFYKNRIETRRQGAINFYDEPASKQLLDIYLSKLLFIELFALIALMFFFGVGLPLSIFDVLWQGDITTLAVSITAIYFLLVITPKVTRMPGYKAGNAKVNPYIKTLDSMVEILFEKYPQLAEYFGLHKVHYS